MEISKIKAVVFDCDGVMFDTAFANRKYFDEVLEAFKSPPLNDEQFVNVHMMTIKGAIEYLFPDVEDLTDIHSVLNTIGYHKFIKFMVIEVGLIDLLIKLKENGFIRGIGTNRTNTMEKVLKDYDLEDHFEVVVTAATVRNPKPDPEQLNLIMDQFDLTPDQVLFVGDSDYDRIAAKRAGTWFVAFRNPNLEADFNVNAMSEIGNILHLN